MYDLLRDLRYAFRTLRRNPGFALAAVTALALGIGANTAIFSVVNTVLLRPLPYKDPDRLVSVWGQDPKRNIPAHFIMYADFDAWRGRSQSFEFVSAYSPAPMTLTTRGEGEPERLNGVRVNAGFLRVLGVRPYLGREFLPEEDKPGGRRAAILSYAVWQRRFGSDKTLIGKPILLDGGEYTLVGVLPQGFQMIQSRHDVYVPLAADTAGPARGPTVGGYARLKPRVTREQAQAETDSILPSLNERFFGNSGRRIRLWGARDFLVRDVEHSLLVLMGAVALVLLIACANVANLLLARAGAREREIAIRAAMGAGRGRLVRQLLTESLLLGAAGGAAGLAIAYWSVASLSKAPARFLMQADVRVDGAVLAFTAVVSLATGLVFGLAPALAVSRADVHDALKEGGRGGGQGMRGGRLRNALVVAEVCLALLLAIGAGLLIKGFARLLDVRAGFNANGVLIASVSLPGPRYPKEEQRAAFFRRVLQELETHPAVQAVGVVSVIPLSGTNSGTAIHFEGRPEPRAEDAGAFWFRMASPGYFRAMQIPVLRGRMFSEQEGRQPGNWVAVVNETFVKRYFPNEEPVGRRFAYGLRHVAGAPGAPPPPWIAIVGVVGDVRHNSLAQEPAPEFFVPFWQQPPASLHLAVRTALDANAFTPELRAAVRAVDKDQPLSQLRSMQQLQSESISERRLSVWLLGAFAGVALVLAAVGIYGVLSFSVTRRTHEIGIRVALGAARGDVLKLVMWQGMRLALMGLALGLVAALFLTRVMRSILYGVGATDPLVFIAITLLLGAVAALAAYIPARRAMRVEPVIALRHE